MSVLVLKGIKAEIKNTSKSSATRPTCRIFF